jgi:YggT family protein
VPSIRGRWTDYVAMLVEPVLTPVRRIIPPMGGLDISFLIVILVIGYVARLAQAQAYACF